MKHRTRDIKFQFELKIKVFKFFHAHSFTHSFTARCDAITCTFISPKWRNMGMTKVISFSQGVDESYKNVDRNDVLLVPWIHFRLAPPQMVILYEKDNVHLARSTFAVFYLNHIDFWRQTYIHQWKFYFGLQHTIFFTFTQFVYLHGNIV